MVTIKQNQANCIDIKLDESVIDNADIMKTKYEDGLCFLTVVSFNALYFIGTIRSTSMVTSFAGSVPYFQSTLNDRFIYYIQLRYFHKPSSFDPFVAGDWIFTYQRLVEG